MWIWQIFFDSRRPQKLELIHFADWPHRGSGRLSSCNPNTTGHISSILYSELNLFDLPQIIFALLWASDTHICLLLLIFGCSIHKDRILNLRSINCAGCFAYLGMEIVYLWWCEYVGMGRWRGECGTMWWRALGMRASMSYTMMCWTRSLGPGTLGQSWPAGSWRSHWLEGTSNDSVHVSSH